MTLKERLILAAIDIIQREGMSGFTIRSVAKECGVSCAAPYKHFKDKEELFLSVIDYVNNRWYEVQGKIAEETAGDIQEQLIAVSMGYIRFITENPHFRAIIMLHDENMTSEQVLEKSQMSSYSRELVSKWCIKAEYTHEQSVRKTFAVRAYIYGSINMFFSGEMEYTPENLELVEKCIMREFELD